MGPLGGFWSDGDPWGHWGAPEPPGDLMGGTGELLGDIWVSWGPHRGHWGAFGVSRDPWGALGGFWVI